MKVLIFGKDGQVGRELLRSFQGAEMAVALGRTDADFKAPEGLRSVIRDIQPDVIINAAAYTAVDQAEQEPDSADLINAQAVSVLAQEANRYGSWLVHYSTDYVFDGKKDTPYIETDKCNPLSVYGASKLSGERKITVAHDKYVILRTCWVYSMSGRNFAKSILEAASQGREVRVVAGQRGVPTAASLVADVTKRAVERLSGSADDLAGVYHLAPQGIADRFSYASYLVRKASELDPVFMREAKEVLLTDIAMPGTAPRPENSLLDTKKLQTRFDIHLPAWQVHVDEFIESWLAWAKSR